MGIFFINSTDRIYNDKELNAVSKILFSTGVFNTKQATRSLWKLSGDFLVEPAGGTMGVTAKPGMASVEVASEGVQQQVIIQEDNKLSASVASNVFLANRNDAVVLRIDQSIITDDDLNAAGSNAVSLVVISGNSANALTDQEIAIALSGDPYVRLADVFVPMNATEITASMITDRRELSAMTRSVQMGSDSFRFFALETDPETLEQGMVWYNSTEGILKMYDGVNTIALQSQDFDWGYYPPSGVDQRNEALDAVLENVSVSGQQSSQVLYNITTGGGFVNSQAQIFRYPSGVTNPLVRVRMGVPQFNPSNVKFYIYTVNGSNKPDSEFEALPEFSADSIPQNGYIEFPLGGAYVPGTIYALVVVATTLGDFDNPASRRSGAVLTSANDEEDDLLGTVIGYLTGSISTNPASMNWSNSIDAGRQFVFSILELTDIAIGETDTTGNNYLVSQAFVTKSKDINGFRVKKGEDVGSPTGSIVARLYLADAQNRPTGDVLTTAEISQGDWTGSSDGDEMTFPLQYADLIVGSKYVVVIDCDDNSDSDYYAIKFGSYTGGRANRFATANGWVSLQGDTLFGVLTSGANKIVVTTQDGFIPGELFGKTRRSTYEVADPTSVTPIIDTSFDVVVLEGITDDITSMTTNLLGNPKDKEQFVLYFKDDGGAETITWGASFEGFVVALPSGTTAGKWTRVLFEYWKSAGKWRPLSVTTQP